MTRANWSKWCFASVVLVGMVGVGAAEEGVAEPAPLVLILDASGSMWGQIEGESKITIARRVVSELVDSLADEQEVGLIAYGHRREGDCEDIETIRQIGVVDREGIKATVEGLNPKGKTPITASVERAFTLIGQRQEPATVVLVSDGLETCDADPCAAVQLAAERGLEFVLHVVGFDVAGEDTASLECAAAAGGGRFLSAGNAIELGLALDQAVALTPQIPDGRLAVRAIRNGELHDVAIRVFDSGGNDVTAARTYTSPDTNPSSIPLEDGTYRVVVNALGVEGDSGREFEVEVVDGGTVERTVDFSTGTLAIGVTRNGALSDATWVLEAVEGGGEAARGRTYTTASSNPSTATLTVGRYRLRATNLEIDGNPEVDLGEVEVTVEGGVKVAHDFDSGELAIHSLRAGAPVDAVVKLLDGAGQPVVTRRTYAEEIVFVLEPGDYRVEAQEIRGERSEIAVTVADEERVERVIEFGG